ncbi:DCL family protein [Erythrobacter sp.]|uniref:DCL family protein n=1 Tax=Erythrobacter sp. TaxID=1042 RepID=UPI003C7858DA
MAKRITLPNGKSWTTQAAALEHFKRILHRYRDDATIDQIEDHDDLLALVERFDQATGEDSKVGAGISHFERRVNRGPGYSTPGFWLVRTDRAETDFSYIRSVKMAPQSILERYYGACRSAVAPDLAAAKQRQFDRFSDDQGRIQCDVSGVLVKASGAQLRHAAPFFGDIIRTYRGHRDWSVADLGELLSAPTDAQTDNAFLSAKDSEDFRCWHHSMAVLHIVSKDPAHGAFSKTNNLVNRKVELV